MGQDNRLIDRDGDVLTDLAETLRGTDPSSFPAGTPAPIDIAIDPASLELSAGESSSVSVSISMRPSLSHRRILPSPPYLRPSPFQRAEALRASS